MDTTWENISPPDSPLPVDAWLLPWMKEPPVASSEKPATATTTTGSTADPQVQQLQSLFTMMPENNEPTFQNMYGAVMFNDGGSGVELLAVGAERSKVEKDAVKIRKMRDAATRKILVKRFRALPTWTTTPIPSSKPTPTPILMPVEPVDSAAAENPWTMTDDDEMQVSSLPAVVIPDESMMLERFHQHQEENVNMLRMLEGLSPPLPSPVEQLVRALRMEIQEADGVGVRAARH